MQGELILNLTTPGCWLVVGGGGRVVSARLLLVGLVDNITKYTAYWIKIIKSFPILSKVVNLTETDLGSL